MNTDSPSLPLTRLGVSSLTWRNELNLPAAIRRVASEGFLLVDAGIIGSMALVGTDDLLEKFDETVGDVEVAMRETGVGIASINTQIPFDMPDNDKRLRAEALARAAACWNVVSGITLNTVPAGKSLELACGHLLPIAGIFLEHGVTPMVESHRWTFTEKPENALALLDAVPGLMFTLDASHYISQGLQPPAWERLMPRVRHAHIRCCNEKELVCPLERHSAATEDWLRSLARQSYAGTLSFEIIQDPESPAAAWEETLALRAQLKAAGAFE